MNALIWLILCKRRLLAFEKYRLLFSRNAIFYGHLFDIESKLFVGIFKEGTFKPYQIEYFSCNYASISLTRASYNIHRRLFYWRIHKMHWKFSLVIKIHRKFVIDLLPFHILVNIKMHHNGKRNICHGIFTKQVKSHFCSSFPIRSILIYWILIE